MPSQRAERVARQVLQEVSRIVEHDVADPRVELVTLTDAHMTPDLRSARLFFSVLGDESAADDAAEALRKAGGFIRRELGRRLSLRYVPDLHFVPDPTAAVAQRLDMLFKDDDGHGGD